MLDFLTDVVDRNRRYHCGDNRRGRGCAWEPINDRHLTEYLTPGERCHNELLPIFIERYLGHTRFNDIGAVSRITFIENVFVRIDSCNIGRKPGYSGLNQDQLNMI